MQITLILRRGKAGFQKLLANSLILIVRLMLRIDQILWQEPKIISFGFLFQTLCGHLWPSLLLFKGFEEKCKKSTKERLPRKEHKYLKDTPLLWSHSLHRMKQPEKISHSVALVYFNHYAFKRKLYIFCYWLHSLGSNKNWYGSWGKNSLRVPNEAFIAAICTHFKGEKNRRFLCFGGLFRRGPWASTLFALAVNRPWFISDSSGKITKFVAILRTDRQRNLHKQYS